MRRASKYKIPWHKCQNDLPYRPKYARLSLPEKGALQVFWCLAYSNHAEVGFLPADQRIIGLYLGRGFANNPSRVPAILNRFVAYGWLDKRIINGVVRYEVHHWRQWQASKFDVFEDRKFDPDHSSPSPFGDENPQLIPSCSPTSPLLGIVNVENKAVTGGIKSKSKYKASLLRKDSQGNFFHDELEDFEEEINKGLVSQSSIRQKEEENQRYYKAILGYMETSWEGEKKFPLKSISDKSDYSSLHGMLARVRPAGFTEGVLQAAWSRFLLSQDRFHKGQSHPIRYFCHNLGSFLESAISVSAGGRPGSKESRADRAERETLELMLSLEKPQV